MTFPFYPAAGVYKVNNQNHLSDRGSIWAQTRMKRENEKKAQIHSDKRETSRSDSNFEAVIVAQSMVKPNWLISKISVNLVWMSQKKL